MTHGCQGFQCKGECIGAADEYWAQTVGSALIRLTVQGKKIYHISDSFLNLEIVENSNSCHKFQFFT